MKPKVVYQRLTFRVVQIAPGRFATERKATHTDAMGRTSSYWTASRDHARLLALIQEGLVQVAPV